MDTTYTPITILLIEDNPALEGIKAKDLKERNFNIGSLDDRIDVPGLNFKKNKGFEHLFILKVLQHPEEIKEYITNCLKKEDEEGSFELGKVLGIVPEIVEFDYKLSDNFQINSENKNIKYWSTYKYLRELYNPNFLFVSDQHLEKQINENYTLKDFIERINKTKNTTGKETWYKSDEEQLINDELGLYAGVEIVRLFRNHTCVGIPATFNKDSIERLHAFSKYYEWMNEYDLGTMFSREERGSKDWDTVLSAAVKQLRIRIETQIKVGKAIPNYWQLNALAEGNFREELIFSIETIYGKRDLPLEGLFIDFTDESERQAKIEEWTQGIQNKLPITNIVIKKANETATTLWNTYISEFEDRIVLSDYTSRIENLNATETSYLEEVKTRLGVNPTTGLITNECSIQTLLSKEDSSIIRLTTLITTTKVAIELEKQRVESCFSEKYPPLTADEYFNVLYPKANLGKEASRTVLLPMNFSNKTEKDEAMDNAKKWLMRGLSQDDSKVKQADIFQFENWILKGEKEILRSLFYKDSMYFPQWLK
ncbi:MAG: hypothetical protein JXB49_22910 [Bacteroidales bacterium]|nr:hypothetical protein [Bacteroidales bacterium]